MDGVGGGGGKYLVVMSINACNFCKVLRVKSMALKRNQICPLFFLGKIEVGSGAGQYL